MALVISDIFFSFMKGQTKFLVSISCQFNDAQLGQQNMLRKMSVKKKKLTLLVGNTGPFAMNS